MARPGRRGVCSSTGREEMAVRRQLQRFFEEPQIRGTIVVERPLSLEPPPAPPPTSEVPRCYELRPEDCAMFQCRGCWAVLGDSLHLCALEEQRLGLLVCLSQCCGPGRGCAYNTLSCQSCGSVVGFVLYSAFRDLAHLRGFFCFFKNSIFWWVPCPLKESLVVAHMRVELLMKKVEQLKQSNVAENRARHRMQLP
uniref:Mis18 domain-containing protein n=1 Tax=Pavo cristatus TaxID=9049 RepID=A0A8C9G8F8_PAVCR